MVRCHPTVSSSAIPFSSCLQSFPASGYFQMSRLFTSGGPGIGTWAVRNVSVQLLSCVRLFASPWTAVRQASLSITNSLSLLKLMSIESVMPSNQLILCLQSFPASGLIQLLSSSHQVAKVLAKVSLPVTLQSQYTPWDTDCGTPGLPVLHHLPELAQTHVHRVGDAIQPSHPLSSPSPPALNLSQ